jgi:hypothetical protein
VTSSKSALYSLYVANGIPYVAYQVNESRKAAVKRLINGNWELVGEEGFSVGQAVELSLAVYKGIPYLLFTDIGDGRKAKLYAYNENQWQLVGGKSLSVGTASRNQLRFDRGIPYVFYVDEGLVNKSLVQKYTGTTWETVGKNPLAIGSDVSFDVSEGVVYLGFQDVNNNFKATVLKYSSQPKLTYSIAPIGNPVFRDLEEGYASDTQDMETITLTNTGTGILNNLRVDVSDDEEVPGFEYRSERTASFEVSKPEMNSLAVNGSTSFTVKAKDNLEPGTYNGTVTINADNLTQVTFKVTQVVQEKKRIIPIGAQTLEPLIQGYADGSPQVVTLTITKAGDEDVEGLGVTTPSYSTASDFPATQPLAVNLTAEHPSTTFTIRFTDRMPAGTYTGTYKIVDKNQKVLDTFTVTQVVQERLPYSIGPISEQVFRELEEGYADDTQETKAITIINTGTKALEGIQVSVRDGFGGPTAEARSTGTSHFEINDADMNTILGKTGSSTSFKVKAKDGLEPGTYVGTVTIEADNLSPVMVKVTQVVHAVEGENPGYIEEISDKTMPEVEEGYSEDFSSETWIPIRRAGTEHPSIYNLRVEITDPNHAFNAPFLTVNGLNEQYQQANLRIKSIVGLLAGTYVGKVKIYSGDLLLDTFTVTLVVNERDTNTYSITPIGDQTLRVLEEDYASNSQETKAITVTNTGTGTLKELRVSVRDQSAIESRAKDNGSFEVTTPLQETLDTGASTTFSVKVRDGLPAGTYVGKVTVKADRMESVTFLVTQVVHAEGETPLTYSITPISDQTLNVLPSGYASGSQEARSITITRTGTADLQNVTVQLYDRMEARATVSESVYFEVTQPVVQTLTSETPSTTFTVKAKDGLAPGTYTTTVRVSAAEMVPVYFKVTQVVNKPSIPDSSPVYYSSSPADPGVDVLVNGKKESAGKMVNTTVDNRTVTTFTLDEEKLTQKITAEGKQAVVTLPIQSQADVIIGELNGRMVKTMATQQAVLEIKTDTATYSLPAQQINIDALSAAIGQDVALADITIQVTLAKAQASTVQLLEKAGQQGGFTPVVSPVSFTITANYKDKTVSVDKFNAYVARTIALPAGVDPNKITTGIVIDPDGTVRHVPTEVTLVNGIYYAKLNSLTNSDYAVVWHPLTFSDASGHWAQTAINDMGSRMVVSGNGQGLFNPNANITRAEFASIVVQGLGLKPAYELGKFSDIAANAWYSGAVSTAHAYGLIAGYPDGSFRPSEQITREQAMTIIAKAMKLTGLKDKLTQQDLAAALAAYTDSSKVAGWAAAGVADCVQAEIIKGRSGATLAPKANLTRAEMAVIVRLLLQNSDLI